MRDYEYSIAKATNTGRKPLRTAGEMAKEFGVKTMVLAGHLRSKDAPKPVIDNRKGCSRRSRLVWYDPTEMRKWWKTKTANAELRGRPLADGPA